MQPSCRPSSAGSALALVPHSVGHCGLGSLDRLPQTDMSLSQTSQKPRRPPLILLGPARGMLTLEVASPAKHERPVGPISRQSCSARPSFFSPSKEMVCRDTAGILETGLCWIKVACLQVALPRRVGGPWKRKSNNPLSRVGASAMALKGAVFSSNRLPGLFLVISLIYCSVSGTPLQTLRSPALPVFL